MLKNRILDLLNRSNFLTLSTSVAGNPSAANVYFANDGFDIYFFTFNPSRKAVQIAFNPKVQCVIRPDGEDGIKELQIDGFANKITDQSEKDKAKELILKVTEAFSEYMHDDFLIANDVVGYYKIKPTTIKYVDFYADTQFEWMELPENKPNLNISSCALLDKTAFYARGGGQEPDHGKISGQEIVDITKHGNIVVHEIKGEIPKEGDVVSCVVDAKRRDGITKNHTSTHIINTSARSVLGSWVWQHSAFKEEDHARLDITHHSALTDEDVTKIEDAANSIIEKAIPVKIENFDRGTAEQKYGFRIYQGGVVPVKSVRIVSIGDLDIEACGGTHVANTSDVEQIKITRTKRIQDGVVRIEFVSGDGAKEFVKKREQDSENKEKEEKLKEQEKEKRLEQRQIAKERIPIIAKSLLECKQGTTTIDEITIEIVESGKANFCYSDSNNYDDVFHIGLGEVLCKSDPKMVYCGLFEQGEKIRAIVYAGDEISKEKSAGDIVKSISQILGGAGGGSAKFAQGGGTDKSKKEDAIKNAKSMIIE